MAKHVAAIDQDTTTTRFMVFDHDGREVARHQLRHEQISPEPGRLEHDPHEIWEATQDVVETGLGRAGIAADDLAAIGIANQTQTSVVWDRRTGQPYWHAIVPGDARADAIGSGGSLRWVLEHADDARADAEAGHAIFGTVDTWLIWWLTGGPDGGRHLTDVTNAGRTMLMDLATLAWDDALLADLDVPLSMLPEIRSSSEVYGHTTADGPFRGEVAVAGDLGSRNAALIGQACFGPAELNGTYDPAGVALLNTGADLVRSTDGPRATLGYRLGGAAPVYALEGTPAEIVALGRDLRELRVDGPASVDEALMQGEADALALAVSRPVIAETAAVGAAHAAGLAVGFWSSTDELVAIRGESRRWEPRPTG